jgi:hypothetical protein
LPKKKNDAPRILLFDLECTNLKGDFGRLLSFGWKWFKQGRAQVKILWPLSAALSVTLPTIKSWPSLPARLLTQADLDRDLVRYLL